MKALVIIALVILAVFIAVGIRLFGLQKSYSAYAPLWAERFKIHNVNLWSLVTTVVALLLVPPMIELSANTPWQPLCFFLPLYLVVVAMTPRYQTDRTQYIIHMVGTFLCAAGFVVYMSFGLKLWYVPLVAAAAFIFFLGLPTRSLKESWKLWLECALFACPFYILLIR